MKAKDWRVLFIAPLIAALVAFCLVDIVHLPEGPGRGLQFAAAIRTWKHVSLALCACYFAVAIFQLIRGR